MSPTGRIWSFSLINALVISQQLYMYQLFRSLAYIHSLGICHRDIKPQNLLLDPKTGVLKLCDFGSAKHLVRGEPNVSYICSRYYRAPELIFGAIDYTTKIGKFSVLFPSEFLIANCSYGVSNMPTKHYNIAYSRYIFNTERLEV